jgi:hypothetical protein
MSVGLLKIGKRIQKQTVLNETLPELYVFSGSLDTNIYNDITSNKNWIKIGVNHYDYLIIYFVEIKLCHGHMLKQLLLGNHLVV